MMLASPKNVQKGCVVYFWALFIFLWSCGREGGGQQPPSSRLENPEEKETAQMASCDFEVVVTEGDFCVIQGTVRDLAVALKSVEGVCDGSATLNVKGFPSGVSHKIFPAPKVAFVEGVARATVKIDSAGVSLKEMATSTLTFAAKRGETTQTAKTDMKVDLPYFDFSLKAVPLTLPIYQGDSASSTVKVKLLGAACRNAPPVEFSLDADSLPPTVSHEMTAKSVIPPGELTLSFKTSSDQNFGIFKAAVVGCCGEKIKGEKNDEKRVEIGLNIMPSFTSDPSEGQPAGGPAEDSFREMEKQGKTFKVESLEGVLKKIGLPREVEDRARKDQEDESKKGYKEVSEEEVQELKRALTRVRPINTVFNVLTFEPASTEHTPFEQLKLEGAYHSGANVGEKWTTVSRVFTMPDGAIVEITEDDLLNSRRMAIYTYVNENINGFPAVFVAIQAPSGKALSLLSWTTQKKYYDLKMEGNVINNGQKEFFLGLARSIKE